MKLGASAFYTVDQLGCAACVNLRILWWWHPRSAETCRTENVRRLCL